MARLGRALGQWCSAFSASPRTYRAGNGGTEAFNGLIELHPLIARGS